MSTAFALAAVTESLRRLIANALASAQNVQGQNTLGIGGDIGVIARPPDRIEQEPDVAKKNLLNLFLYNVTRNTGWWNEGLPVRDAAGDRVAAPPLALDLHYLVTAYGSSDLHAEALLGHAMQCIHETGVLTRDGIRKALAPPSQPTVLDTALATCRLAEQVEQIKLTHEPINTEEISRVWSAMNAHYRPTAGYLVTVVLVEAARSRKAALPVREWNVYVPPFREPEIDAVEVADAPRAPILPDSLLAIRGRRLSAQGLAVRVNGIDLTAAVTGASDSEIRLTLVLPQPAGWPAGLRAGVAVVQVIQPLAMGNPPAEHAGSESNVAPFVLRPAITAQALPGATQSQLDGQTVKAGEIEVSFDPPVGLRQRVVLLLNERDPPATRPARAHSFAAPPDNGLDPAVASETSKIRFAYRRVVGGRYLARVQVDGAESVLDVDPASGRYASPSVTI